MTKVSLITPTADQPTGIALAERWIARQTIAPHQWIVADDGEVPATLTMGQTHLVRKRTHEGGRSLAGNLLAALEQVTGDVVMIIEHDDWYSATHIETCAARLQHAGATGSQWQRYHNIQQRVWIVLKNIGSALCNTAFDARFVPHLRKAARTAFDRGSYGVDRLFWESLPAREKDIHTCDTVVGIKGLPGRKGLGMGHRPDNRREWHHDPRLEHLRVWVGEEVSAYEGLY